MEQHELEALRNIALDKTVVAENTSHYDDEHDTRWTEADDAWAVYFAAVRERKDQWATNDPRIANRPNNPDWKGISAWFDEAVK